MRTKPWMHLAVCWLLKALFAAVWPVLAATLSGPSTVIILHTNDLHFDFNFREDFEQVVAYYRDRYPNVWLVDGGDIFVRHAHRWPVEDLAFYAERANFMIDTMNEVGYDVAVLGNHELDAKEWFTRDALRRAIFPLLGANVEVLIEDQFDPPEPYVVFETVEGYTIAVLGISIGRYGVARATNRDEAIRAYRHLGQEHDVWIALTHIGANRDRSLAEKFGEIDVIIGGHSHTLLNPAEIINGVLVAQAGGNPHYVDPARPQSLGVIRLVIEDGDITQKSGKVLTLDGTGEALSTLPDAAALALP